MFINNLSSVKNLSRLFSLIIKEIPTIIPSTGVSIFVFTPHLVFGKHLSEYALALQNTTLDGKFLDVVGL